MTGFSTVLINASIVELNKKMKRDYLKRENNNHSDICNHPVKIVFNITKSIYE